MLDIKTFIMKKYKIDKKFNFGTWFIGTNVFDIWKNIIWSIREEKDSRNWNSILSSDSIRIWQTSDNKYNFTIGDYNILSKRISSRNNSEGSRAISTLLQYIDCGIALKFINEEKSKKGKFKYKLYPNFISLINRANNKENLDICFLDKILSLLRSFLYSNNMNVKRIGSSISWAIIRKYCEKHYKDLENIVKDKIINLKMRNNKGNGIVQFEGAYNSLAEQLINKFQLEYLMEIISNSYNSYYSYYFKISKIELNDVKNMLQYDESKNKELTRYRTQLRRTIIDCRVKNKSWYSDFKEEINIQHIDDLQACHIKEHWQIKDELKNTNDASEEQKLLNQLKDKDNGILLNPDVHHLFDKRLFEIDPRNGHIVIEDNNDSKKRVCRAFGVELDKSNSIYLKDTVLTNEMKEYIRQRD